MSAPASYPHVADTPESALSRGARKIVFASAHSIVDFSNGASVASLDVLNGLCTSGFECLAFCTPKLDLPEVNCLEQVLDSSGEQFQVVPAVCGAQRARILYTQLHDVPVTVVHLESSPQRHLRPDYVRTVVGFFRSFLEMYQPDVMLTYGGDPITNAMIDMARRRGIPVVFAIHNFGYVDPRPFAKVDYCIVPSQLAQRYYRDQVGLNCHALSNPVDWERVQAKEPAPQFVTFVNPSLQKGAYAFVRIALELGRRRPDIPLLVVESRGTRDTLAACGLNLGGHTNVRFMPNTSDPRQFWGVTRIAFMPSLCWENQPLVAVEAMINGIPIIASDRGGTPETLGGCGFGLPLPAQLTPMTHILATTDEIQPWVEAIISLWDVRALYEEESGKATNEALRWHPDRLRPLYAKFFNEVTVQTRSPVIQKKEGAISVVNPARGARVSIASTTCSAERPHGEKTPLNTRPGVVPISFVVCVSDEETPNANFMASPCVADTDSPHQNILLREVPDAACGLNFGLKRATHDWAVCAHQDVYLPRGWDQLLINQLYEAERRFGTIGVAGVYGVGEAIAPHDRKQPLAAERIGWVVDRGRELRDGPELPAPVATLDELLLVVRRDSGLQFDPALGFHLYGADICLHARERGLAVVALGALCHHNSRSVGLPEAFFRSAKVFARKWSHRLPVATPCAIIDRGGRAHVLGNAEPGPRSIAYALSSQGQDRVGTRVSRNFGGVLSVGHAD